MTPKILRISLIYHHAIFKQSKPPTASSEIFNCPFCWLLLYPQLRWLNLPMAAGVFVSIPLLSKFALVTSSKVSHLWLECCKYKCCCRFKPLQSFNTEVLVLYLKRFLLSFDSDSVNGICLNLFKYYHLKTNKPWTKSLGLNKINKIIILNLIYYIIKHIIILMKIFKHVQNNSNDVLHLKLKSQA